MEQRIAFQCTTADTAQADLVPAFDTLKAEEHSASHTSEANWYPWVALSAAVVLLWAFAAVSLD
jgi:hypothetical protein